MRQITVGHEAEGKESISWPALDLAHKAWPRVITVPNPTLDFVTERDLPREYSLRMAHFLHSVFLSVDSWCMLVEWF